MTRSLRPAPLAVAAVLASAAPALAGWDNVFQVCCHDCRPRASFYAPPADPCPQPCPQPEARVSYVQRCYYQPVTEYRRESYYVPVRENVTSYYYEPVTSYSYTSYYDPCSGCSQDIAVPRTSYRLRQQCNSVVRYVERSRSVPVTSYRPVTTYQPVVTYYYPPSTSMYLPAAPTYAPPRVEAAPPASPPRVMDSATDPIPNPNLEVTPGGGASQPRTMPGKTEGRTRTSNAYTASRRTGALRGEVLLSDQATPRPGAKLVFVSAADHAVREYAKANEFGEFDVRLPAGEWYVYLGQGTGRADYHKKITVNEDDARTVALVSR